MSLIGPNYLPSWLICFLSWTTFHMNTYSALILTASFLFLWAVLRLLSVCSTVRAGLQPSTFAPSCVFHIYALSCRFTTCPSWTILGLFIGVMMWLLLEVTHLFIYTHFCTCKSSRLRSGSCQVVTIIYLTIQQASWRLWCTGTFPTKHF